MTKQEYDIIKEFLEQLHIILESLLDENGEYKPKDTEPQYPRWFEARDSDISYDLICEFNGLKSAKILLDINNTYQNKKDTEIEWISHTDTNIWKELTIDEVSAIILEATRSVEPQTSRRYSYYRNMDDDSADKTVTYYSNKHHDTLVQDGLIKNEKDFIDVKI